MKRQTGQDSGRCRRNGFLRKRGDFLNRCEVRVKVPGLPIITRTNFNYRWHTDPTSSGLLYNPGNDPCDPLAGLVVPRQLGAYVGTRYGAGKAGHKPEENTDRVFAPLTQSFSAPKYDTYDRRPLHSITHTGVGKENYKPEEYPNRSLSPAKAALLNTRLCNTFRAPQYDCYDRRPLNSAANSFELCFPRFSRAPKNELLKRATINKLVAEKEKTGHKYKSPYVEDTTASAADSVDATQPTEAALKIFESEKPAPKCEKSKLTIVTPTRRKRLFSPVIPEKASQNRKRPNTRTEVFDTAPAKPEANTKLPRSERNTLTIETPTKRRKLFNPAVKSTPETNAPSTQAFPERNTLVLQPTQTATVQVTDTTGTRSFTLEGRGYRRLILQQPEDWGQPLQSPPSGARSAISYKRRAEDTEFDLLVADVASQAQQSTNHRGSTVQNLEKQGQRATGRRVWLSNTMTSVRGTFAKVYSIAGYVNPRNYNVVERHSHDEHSGDIITKRIKVDPNTDLGGVSGIQDEHRINEQQPQKTRLVWIDESARIANWHQVAALAQALKDIGGRVQRGRAVERSSSPGFRLDEESRSGRLHTLSAHVKSFQQTARIIEHIYSHTFLARLKEVSKVPQQHMDYVTNPDEYLAISAAKLFLDELPKECASSLIEAGVTPRIIKGVGADLDAIVNQRPMPGLVQKAGFVGKMIKFIRGHDSFGVEPSSAIMPGSFPTTETNSELVSEQTITPLVKSESEPQWLETKSSRAYTPVTQTETYAYVRDHFAEMETKRKFPQKTPPEKASEEFLSKAIPNPILKMDRSSPALKRLQKSRGLKRVHFSPSAKQSSPLPAKSPGFFRRMFRRHETNLSSPLRLYEDESSLCDSQTDGSPDANDFEKFGQHEPESDNTSQDSDNESTMSRCRPRLVQRLNKSLDLASGDQKPSSRSRSPSPLTLSGLRISDDKEGELDDFSADLQLIFDVDEARRRAEEARKAKEAEAERLRLTGGLRAPKRRLVTPLSPSWSQRAQDTIRANPNVVLAVTAESVELRRHDFLKVVPETEWLNDEIVNGSLLWVDRYVNEAAGASEVKSPKRVCLFLNSFFYKRLEDNGVQGTERTLRRFGVSKTNFLSLETILMPICRNNHWTLLVVRPQKRTVSHMDSLNPRGTAAHTRRALDWIEAVLGDDFKADEWKTVRHEAPGQDNGYDCGVFTITNGICLALGVNAIDAYSNDELPLQRLRIAAMLLNKGFRGEFDLSDL